MNTKALKNLVLTSSVAAFVTSCGVSASDGGALGSALGGVPKAAGDAAVDAATKVNPLTGAAVRNATGFGTDPVEQASTGLLNKIGL